MRVYPWRQKNNQGNRKMVMRFITRSAVIFRILGGVLTLGVGSLTGLLLVNRFAKRNDSWAQRGALMSLAGLVLFLILGGLPAWATALPEMLHAFGKDSTTSPLLPALGFIIRSFALGAVFQGIAVMMASYVYEVTGDRYLDRTLPTGRMKRRAKRNEAALIQNEKKEPDSIAFGLIVDDPIPWRTPRYGMVCARPMEDIGHGVIVGANGTGKTVLAHSLAFQAASLDAAVVFADFKASLRTLETLKQAAHKAGRKFYSFDLGTGSTETTWYDPLDWPGDPSAKASMIVNSLNFTEDGSAAYYRGQANDWLILQFSVINEVGLYPGESSFDFLYQTATPIALKDRILKLRRGDERQQKLYTEFEAKISQIKAADLSALRQNLSIVVNAGGDRLRPQSDAPAILMSRIVEEGAVVYFGLSPSTDQVALKTIGSLILRNLGVLAGERMRDPNLDRLRPIFAFIDEASRLQERAVVMDNLFATSREGRINLWTITQSFATWPHSTVVEMNTNVQTHVAFRVQDEQTAQHLVSTLGDVPVLQEMSEDKVEHRAFQGDVKERSGDARTTLATGSFLSDAPMNITSMQTLHAYVWFTGTATRATLEEWRPRRLKKPDQIDNDAPLLRIVFMDYTSEKEPIKGSTFEQLVTSPDDLNYHLDNSTLRRTRRETLTDDNYDNIHLPGSQSDGHRGGYGHGTALGGYGPDITEADRTQTRPIDAVSEPVWDDGPALQWGPSRDEAPTAPLEQAAPNDIDDFEWDDDANLDAQGPPTAFFYKGGNRIGTDQSRRPPSTNEPEREETSTDHAPTDATTSGPHSVPDEPHTAPKPHAQPDGAFSSETPPAQSPHRTGAASGHTSSDADDLEWEELPSLYDTTWSAPDATSAVSDSQGDWPSMPTARQPEQPNAPQQRPQSEPSQGSHQSPPEPTSAHRGSNDPSASAAAEHHRVPEGMFGAPVVEGPATESGPFSHGEGTSRSDLGATEDGIAGASEGEASDGLGGPQGASTARRKSGSSTRGTGGSKGKRNASDDWV